jgi:homoserine dehydrogenase
MLRDRVEEIARVAGGPVEVRRALVRDVDRARETVAPDGMLTTDFAAVRDDPDIRVVAEVMGGIDPTRQYLLELFAAGKSVVSANKQLLARHGVQLRFEASVCAAIPVVKVLRESMIANDVSAVLGIVNGTTNFILSAMAGGQDYATALARAQELGYAEADPTEDVNGADAAAKIAILASIAFHTRVTIEDVPFEGIERLEAIDSAVARELGYRIKLIASAERLEGGVAARVHPTLVPDGHPLATIEGSFNAVMLRGSAIREITLAGPGAGGDETASAVIGDVMTVLGTSGTGFFTHDGYFRQVPIVPEADVPSAFYLRLDVLDAPGVLAQISRVLADQQVSIESVIQRAFDGRAQLVVTTHPAPEGRFFSAVHGIQALGVVAGDPHVLRVLPR